jgi:hypothetical protein
MFTLNSPRKPSARARIGASISSSTSTVQSTPAGWLITLILAPWRSRSRSSAKPIGWPPTRS